MSKENEDFLDEIKSLPECIEASEVMALPNQDIPIYQGEFQILQESTSIVAIGSITFSWYPEAGTKFETTEILAGDNHILMLDISLPCQIFIDGLLFGKAYIQNIRNTSFIKGVCNQAVLGDIGIKVSSIRFSVPNLLLSDGERLKKTCGDQISFFNGRTVFDNDVYKIVIDKAEKYDDLERSLQATGGYIVTCGGEIIKKNGPISLRDIEELLLSFNNFLCLVNGRQTSLCFLKGMHEDQIIWSDYLNYFCEPYKVVRRWARVMDLGGLNHMWLKFADMWRDQDKKDFLLYAIHWYSQANSSSGSTEGSIIFAQTGLELFYNWLLIEQKRLIIGSDASGLSAANKIRLLLSQISVTTKIPVGFSHLLSIEDIEDGPEIFTIIRNALVHGQEKKRRDLRDITVLAKYEALELGLWYLELSLLYILDYKGKYSNRTLKNGWFGAGDTLPWAKDGYSGRC